jgi:hypothetical protein
MKKARFISILLLAAAILLLGSCLGVEMDLKINRDGSGTADMAFHISQIFFQLDPESQDVPVPITKEEMEASYAGVDGITVLDVTEEDMEEKKIITASLKFNSVEALTGGDQEMFEGAVLEKEGDRTIFRTILKEAAEDGMEAEESNVEQEEMVKQYFAGYSFVYRVQAPSKIRSHSIGELSADGKTVTYEMPMYEFNSMKNSEPLVMELSW